MSKLSVSVEADCFSLSLPTFELADDDKNSLFTDSVFAGERAVPDITQDILEWDVAAFGRCQQFVVIHPTSLSHRCVR